MTAIVLMLALMLQQPAPTPPQRPAEITISVEEYARLKTCEAQIEELKTRKPKPKSLWVAIGAVAAIAIVAVAKKKQ